MRNSNKEKLFKVFGSEKPILGMLHLTGNDETEKLSVAKKEIEIFIKNKVDGIIVENYFANVEIVEKILNYLNTNQKKIVYGVNVLGDDKKGFDLAKKYNAKFIQIDSVSGHLTPEDDRIFEKFIEKEKQKNDILILGGVRFKYQPYLSGRSLEEDLNIAKKRADAIVVTGSATGIETDISKVKEFRDILGCDFPLIIGAGLTLENLSSQLKYGDGGIIGSYFKHNKKDSGFVKESHVVNILKERDRILEGLNEN